MLLTSVRTFFQLEIIHKSMGETTVSHRLYILLKLPQPIRGGNRDWTNGTLKVTQLVGGRQSRARFLMVTDSSSWFSLSYHTTPAGVVREGLPEEEEGPGPEGREVSWVVLEGGLGFLMPV